MKIREVGQTPDAVAIELAECAEVGDISVQAAEVQATRLKDKYVRYLRGLTEGQTLEIQCYLLTDDASQNRFTAARNNGTNLEITVSPDDTKSEFKFNFVPLTMMIRSGNPGDPKRRVFNGRLNSGITEQANTNPAYIALAGGGS